MTTREETTMTTKTISIETLARNGWFCPRCGAGLLRAGEPNAPEIAVCMNDDCAAGPLTILPRQEGQAMSQHTPGPQCDCGGGPDPAVYHDRPCPMWRIMTAAPKMLAALRAIVRIIDGSQPTDYPGALMVAHAAIRQATEG